MSEKNSVNNREKDGIIMGEPSAPSLFERQQFIKLLVEIAKRLHREKQDDVAKSA